MRSGLNGHGILWDYDWMMDDMQIRRAWRRAHPSGRLVALRLGWEPGRSVSGTGDGIEERGGGKRSTTKRVAVRSLNVC